MLWCHITIHRHFRWYILRVEIFSTFHALVEYKNTLKNAIQTTRANPPKTSLFNCSTCLIQPFYSPLHSPCQTTFTPKLPLPLRRSSPHLIHPLSTPNGIQIQSAVLPQYTLWWTDRPTNRWARQQLCSNTRLHFIDCIVTLIIIARQFLMHCKELKLLQGHTSSSSGGPREHHLLCLHLCPSSRSSQIGFYHVYIASRFRVEADRKWILLFRP